MITPEMLWKSSAVLLAAFAATAAMRRAPAAWRHFLWTAAFAALLILPLIGLVIPKWTPPVGVARMTVAEVVSTPVSPAAPSPAPAINWLPMIWLAGCAAVAVRFLAGAGRTAWMVRQATELPAADDLCRTLGIRRRVRILSSADAPMPMTWGILRPVVVLPAEAARWAGERVRTVLLHELVHVRRYDLLAQTFAQAACCFYWFHPLAWLALRQLRNEREGACDDAVLLRGVAAHEYATHLLDLVRGLAARSSSIVNAPAMAESSGFESRIRALLDGSRKREPLSYRAAGAIVVMVAALLIPIAGITVHAQAAGGTLAGIVHDPSGARVPECAVTAKNLDGTNQETTVANAAGEFHFGGVPSGRYKLEFRKPGFRPGTKEVTLVAGAVAYLEASLEIGSISQAVTIVGSRSGVSAAQPMRAPQQVRVGGNITQARLLRQIRPVYSDEMKQLGLEGTVSINAILSKNGTLVNPQVINTVDPRLARAALDAVMQWQYTPTLLNGQPVEVLTKIDLDFRLSQ